MEQATPHRDRLDARHAALKNERASWIEQWRDVSRHVLPRNGRFVISDRNKGYKRWNTILDNTGTRALRILGAGLMGGATSPARPWFRLAIPDTDLMNHDPVKLWLSQVQRRMLDVFQRSNTYRALHTMYEDMGAFGTSCSIMQSDFNQVIRHYVVPLGEYSLAQGFNGEINAVYREFQKTVGEIVGEFGYRNCSRTVQGLYDRGSLDQWVTLVHVIEPRHERDPLKLDARNMPIKSVYYEQGATKDRYLRVSGFKTFPALAPRWITTGGDVYGVGPGMEALGDIKQLQHEQTRKAEGIDFHTRPPLQAPSALKGAMVNLLPGGVTYVDAVGPQGGVRTSFQATIDLQYLLADINDVRGRINQTFYTDLFLMLASQPLRTGVTATEVAERHEEKLLMLGPVLERLHNELLDPLIDTTFARLLEAGLLPEPPQELQGVELQVEYVSMLAQAQRAVATNSVDRYVASLGMVAQVKPDVLDKFDSDVWADQYADMLGVDPKLIVPDAKVALIRQQRAEVQQALAQQEQAAQAIQNAQALSQADTSGKNALTDATAAFAGYS